ncbi:hypothetical protein [Cellulomonas sp. Root137]|uniref:hypothetical protein n=1 Tax=Cellulomonas sp. Root137 TaxID=1736459 RepID=UPI00138F9523|nr:hypothetical protein [Cellulomonas sp. Root137]
MTAQSRSRAMLWIGVALVAISVVTIVVLPWGIPVYSDYPSPAASSNYLSPAWRKAAIVVIAGASVMGFLLVAMSLRGLGRDVAGPEEPGHR